MLQQTSLRLFNIPQRKSFSINPARFLPPTGDVSPQTSDTSALPTRAEAGEQPRVQTATGLFGKLLYFDTSRNM